MTTMLTLRDAVVAGIRAAFPTSSVPTVEVYDGPADADFMKRYAKISPAIIITVLGGPTKPRGGSLYKDVAFGAYIFTKSRSDTQRTAAAVALEQRLVQLVLQGTWDTPVEYAAPSMVESRSEFDGELEGMGLTMWTVSWESKLRIPGMTADEHADLEDFASLFAKIYNPAFDVDDDEPLAEHDISPEQAP